MSSQKHEENQRGECVKTALYCFKGKSESWLKILFNSLNIFLLRLFFCFSKGRKTEKDRERMPTLCWYIPPIAAVARAEQSQSRTLELHPGLPCWSRNSSIGATCCCFPRCVNRKLPQNWSSRYSNQHCYGVLAGAA